MKPFRVLDFGRIRVRVQVAPITEDGLRQQLEEEALSIRSQVAGHSGQVVEKAIVINHPNVDLVPSNATIRQMQAEWLKRNEELIKLTCLGMGFVVSGTITRGIITAVFWLAPLPMPCTTHATLEAAIDWALAEIEKSGGSPAAPEIVRLKAAAVERALRVA